MHIPYAKPVEEIEVIPMNGDATRVSVQNTLRYKPKNAQEFDSDKMQLAMLTHLSYACYEEWDLASDTADFPLSPECLQEMKDYLSLEWAGERRHAGSEALDKAKHWKQPVHKKTTLLGDVTWVHWVGIASMIIGVLLIASSYFDEFFPKEKFKGFKTKAELKKEKRMLAGNNNNSKKGKRD
ncbi:hypothetical protein TeGR_g9137 [Tetraparma gracilis]|uniref:Uncharacterized protein n=1 Tax=Tetraparma gracilis TaxID=2962635 RepID=A0ABQ6M9R1_9STRA|nr:hypothetical protein TeGR_g9137 [Tetraparma gracilis]